MNIRRVSRLDMKDPVNRRDRLPAPGAIDARGLGGPRDLDPTEARALVALHEHNPSTLAALGEALGVACDALRPTLHRLAGRGLVVPFGPYGSAYRLTRPAGRDLAALLADQPPRCGNPTTKE